MPLRIVVRTIVLDQQTARVLLVRNKDATFWYAPGGGWDFEIESVEACAIRETLEETGINIHPTRLLYVQEFRPDNGDTHLELFWLGVPLDSTELKDICDIGGIVEEARWFTQAELESITVYPKKLKSAFWNELSSILTVPDPFLK